MRACVWGSSRMSSTVSSTSMPSDEDLLKAVLCRTYQPGKRLSGRLMLMDYSDKRKPWQVLSLVLAVICLLLTAALITVTFTLQLTITHRQPENEQFCFHRENVDKSELFKGPVNPFSELTATEIQAVVTFLQGQRHLNLSSPDVAQVNSNYIHVMEMLMPPKEQVLRFLQGTGARPKRMARVFIMRGSLPVPVVEEYQLGPLPNISNFSLIRTEARRTSVEYTMRPFTKHEFTAVAKHVLPTVLEKAGRLLNESYGASLLDCTEECLRFTMTPVSSGFLEPGKRKSWFWFAYDMEFYTLHPLDFQFLVDMTASDPTLWEVQRVFYANTLFRDLDELMKKYNGGSINVTRTSFPERPARDQYSAVYLRGKAQPADKQPPPQQVQVAEPRYDIDGNVIQYMDWAFHVRVSPTLGTQLFNVRYRGEMILYELSMQEIGVLYSGNSPAPSMLYFADSAGLFGTRQRGMMPGIDCPEHGTILDALAYTSNSKGLKRFENSLCIFEHTAETPLRRHRAYGMSGAFYSGLVDQVLIVRMYICLINYDYVIDYVFHNNGALEVKVSSTGYLASSFYFPEEEKFGTRISDTVIAGLHHHLFHFKADVDIKGTANRFQTWNIGVEEKSNAWADNPHRYHYQNFFEKVDRTTEQEALYSFDFDHPKYLIFYKNESTNLGHKPSYRLIHKGMTKPMLPKGLGFEPSMSWARHQLAVTKRKDAELTSSSMFAMWDAQDPVVNFQNYYKDDESIVDEDLVAWISLGMYHIPQMENVPNTGTIGTTQSFFLVPFNYFPEDPSVASRDAVKVMPLDPSNPNAGAHVERHSVRPQFDCFSRQLDSSIRKNSSFLFS